MSIIYKITNKINGKSYIGKTEGKNYIKYIEGHFRLAKNGDDKVFYKAIRKYGKNNFEVDIIWKGKYKGKPLGRLEIFFIGQYNSFLKGYNMTKGGEGCDWSGRNHIKRSKMKMSRTVIEQYKNGRVHHYKGKKLSKEHCKNISKNHVDVSGEKNPMYGSSRCNDTASNAKKWLLIDPFNNIYHIHGTLNKFIEENNLSRGILFSNLGKMVPEYTYSKGRRTKKRINTTGWVLTKI